MVLQRWEIVMKITEGTRLYVGSVTEHSAEKQVEKNANPSDRARVFAGTIGIQNPLDEQMQEKRAAAM